MLDRAEFYSRKQASLLLGVTQSHLHQSIDGKHLHPERENGRVWYAKKDVDAFVLTYKRKHAPKSAKKLSLRERRERGVLASKVFKLLAGGADFRQCVIETAADPALVRELWHEYNTSFEKAEADKRAEAERVKQEKEIARQRREDAKREYLRMKLSPAPAASSMGISARRAS